MSIPQPAAPPDDYSQSPSRRIPVRSEATVTPLHPRRPEPRTGPEQNRGEPQQTRAPNSGPQSGTGITLRGLPGDWASIEAVWKDSPEALRQLVERTRGLRDSHTPPEVALMVWSALVLPPRAALHLLSWVLTHPLRTLAATVLVAVFLATL